MIELHAADWITITGRGKVAIIDTPWSDLSLLKNQVVRIDGYFYLVRGIESFYPRKPHSPFGLLVREVPESEPDGDPALLRTQQGVQ